MPDPSDAEVLSVLFEEAPHATALLGLDTRMLKVNRAGGAFFGLPPEQLVGRSWLEFLDSDQADASAANVRGLLAGGESRVTVVRPYRRSDGSRRWMRGTLAVVRDGRGAPRFFVAQCLDITEERQLEEQVRRSQRLETMGRLAGGIAHDLNNMLSVILNIAELGASASDAQESCAQIRTAASRAADLTRRLMIFGRRDFVVPEVLDANDVVREFWPFLQGSLGEDVELVAELTPSPRMVCLGLPHVEQILLNLVLNARDAMPGGGRIRIRTANTDLLGGDPTGLAAGPYLEISVTDTGTGMTPEIAAQVFEPFFTTKEIGKGTGLGLSMVHHVVLAAQGHIRVRTAPGEGATFTLLLPATARVPTPAAASVPRPNPRGRGERILVVEDEPALLGLLAHLLEDNGFVALAGANAEQALEICEAPERIDLLLTDIVMPGLSGVQLAARVRERRPDVRVLFMSGHTDDRLASHHLDQDRASFLAKPFRFAELLVAIRDVLDA